MAYDGSLAARVRSALAGRNDVVEKPMFGGLTFMIAGNMCCGVHRNELVLRLDAATEPGNLNSPHVRAWDFMKRPMRGMFSVSAAGCASQETVGHWVELALKHALSLPPKTPGPPKRRRAPLRSISKG
jgi:TfoX/Sxy family transcriptional regulator of competence genes